MARPASTTGTAKKPRSAQPAAATKSRSATPRKAKTAAQGAAEAPVKTRAAATSAAKAKIPKSVQGEDSSPAVRRKAPARSAPDRSPQRRRRSADPGQRRDPARTRQLILESASEEFGRFGYDGARVIRIAERAGIAHQLITYHFGGKRGLFDALSDRWIAASNITVAGDDSMAEMISLLVHQASEDPAWARLLVREGLHDQDHADLMARLAPWVATARMRQERGEIHPDLEPGIVVLVLFAANIAPITLPHVTRALSTIDPSDPKFIDFYADQLAHVMRHLGGPTNS